jgi:hypothetical protein
MRKFLISCGAAAALLLGGAGSALAATASPPNYTTTQASYQISSHVRFNDERATFTIPKGSDSTVYVGLQGNINSGETVVMEAKLVSGQYLLEAAQGFVTNTLSGTPNLSTLTFHPIASVGAPAGTPLFSQAAGGKVYLDVRQSTREHVVNFIEGPSETDAAVLASDVTGVPTSFFGPFIGAVNAAPFASGVQAVITRGGVTEPSGENIKTKGGKRVTFDAFPLVESIATQNGSAPGPGNATVLTANPALPGVGSAYTIVTP